MTTSPIAATPLPTPASGCLGAPADNCNFQQVLQQAKSDADSGAQSSGSDTSAGVTAGSAVPDAGATIGGTTPNESKSAVMTATQAISGDANSFASFYATHLKASLADISTSSRTKEEKAPGKVVASGATGDSKTKVDAGKKVQTLSGFPSLVSNYVVPVALPVDPVPVTASVASAQGSSSTQASTILNGTISAGADTPAISFATASETVSGNLPSAASVPLASASAVTSSAAASLPAVTSATTASSEVSTTEATPTAGDSAVVSTAEGNTVFSALIPATFRPASATAKAKPRVANSATKANSGASSTNSTGAVSVSGTAQPVPVLDPAVVTKTSADGKFNASQSSAGQSNTASATASADGDKTAHSSHSKAESKSDRGNPSATQETTSTPAASIGHDSLATAATVIAHTQPSPTPQAAAPAASNVETAQPATTAVAPTIQSGTPASTQERPQIQPNPIPGPPRMVDSGQLRVNPNSSELKISVQLPELGKIEVRAVTTHDVTTAHLTATRADALQVLATDRTGLEQALKSRDVVLGSMSSHAQEQSAGQQRQQNSQSPAQASGGISSSTAPPSSSTDTVSTSYLPDHASISVRA